jgi:hypothetical protein
VLVQHKLELAEQTVGQLVQHTLGLEEALSMLEPVEQTVEQLEVARHTLGLEEAQNMPELAERTVEPLVLVQHRLELAQQTVE